MPGLTYSPSAVQNPDDIAAGRATGPAERVLKVLSVHLPPALKKPRGLLGQPDTPEPMSGPDWTVLRTLLGSMSPTPDLPSSGSTSAGSLAETMSKWVRPHA